MATQRDNSGTRPKVKEEVEYGDYGDAPGRETDILCDSEHVFRLRQVPRKLAADAIFSVQPADGSAGTKTPARTDVKQDVNKDGGTLCNQLQMKTPKYSGKADWEAFYTQYELLAKAAG